MSIRQSLSVDTRTDPAPPHPREGDKRRIRGDAAVFNKAYGGWVHVRDRTDEGVLYREERGQAAKRWAARMSPHRGRSGR